MSKIPQIYFTAYKRHATAASRNDNDPTMAVARVGNLYVPGIMQDTMFTMTVERQRLAEIRAYQLDAGGNLNKGVNIGTPLIERYSWSDQRENMSYNNRADNIYDKFHRQIVICITRHPDYYDKLYIGGFSHEFMQIELMNNYGQVTNCLTLKSLHNLGVLNKQKVVTGSREHSILTWGKVAIDN